MNLLLKQIRMVYKMPLRLRFAATAIALIVLLLCAFIAVLAFGYGQRLASSALLNKLDSIVLSIALSVSVFSSFSVLFLTLKRRSGLNESSQKRSLKALKFFIDLVPPPRLRKRLTKLLADQSAHVTQLRKSKRRIAAHWIIVTTWALVVWYVLLSPIHALWGVILSPLRGIGD